MVNNCVIHCPPHPPPGTLRFFSPTSDGTAWGIEQIAAYENCARAQFDRFVNNRDNIHEMFTYNEARSVSCLPGGRGPRAPAPGPNAMMNGSTRSHGGSGAAGGC